MRVPNSHLGLCSVLAVLLPAAASVAASADLTIGGASHQLIAADMPSMFGTSGPGITSEDLESINASLTDAGIDTVGHLSIMLANTSRGVTLISLFGGDDGSAPGTPPTSILGVQMAWQGSDTSLVNQDAGGSWNVSPAGDDLIGAGAFQWQQGLSYEALALADLVNMQSVELQLFDLGLYNMEVDVLQLITFGDSGAWEVEGTASFSETHEIVVDATIVIPIPAPGGLALLACGSMFAGRRRRRA